MAPSAPTSGVAALVNVAGSKTSATTVAEWLKSFSFCTQALSLFKDVVMWSKGTKKLFVVSSAPTNGVAALENITGSKTAATTVAEWVNTLSFGIIP